MKIDLVLIIGEKVFSFRDMKNRIKNEILKNSIPKPNKVLKLILKE